MARIRPARSADAPAIARIHVRTWQESYRGIVPQAYLDAMDVQKRTDKWSSILRARESTTLVAEEMAGIVGFVSVGAPRSWSGLEQGEVWALYVAPERQRQGTGAALFRAGREQLARDGRGDGLMLWVLSANTLGRAFYAKMGGTPGITKVEEMQGVPLEEVAYVWPALQQR